MNQRWSFVCAAVSLSLGSLACDPSDPCDPGYYADHGACYRQATGDASTQDAATLDAAAPDAATASYEGFGKSCSKASDCSGAASSCGAPMSPMCTAINCLKMPKICPPDWQCIDVSAFSPDPNVTSACVKL
jgi:hypothetical protein